MAEALAGLGHNGASGNVLAGISQADYLRLLEEYEERDQAVADAVAGRKDQRAKIKSLGIPLKAWDRARRDAEVSGEKRELEEQAYRQMMSWRMKPVGYQAGMNLETDREVAALSVHELHRVDTEGFEAGKAGRKRDANSYTPETEAFTRWDTAWVRGQAEIASTLGNGASHAPPPPPPEQRARRVRRGAAAERPAADQPRRRGRPPGSKDSRPRRGRASEGADQQVH